MRSERNTPAVVPIIEAGASLSADLPSVSRGTATGAALRPQVDELLVCSLQGEVLHEWQCSNTNGRVGLLEALSEKARKLAQGLPLGDFDRLEVNGADARIIAQVQSDRSLFLRTSLVPAEPAAGAQQP
jgi:hypothetical protein